MNTGKIMEKDLVPPGLTYLADNIVSKQNILGINKEQSARWAQHLDLPRQAETVFFAGCGYQYSGRLGALMSLIRQMDKSVIGAEMPMRFARFQKKLGINLPGIYSNVLSRGGGAEIKPLEDAVKCYANWVSRRVTSPGKSPAAARPSIRRDCRKSSPETPDRLTTS